MQRMLVLAGIMTVMSRSANCQSLSWQGVGPVQLGMTVKAAEHALKAMLLPRKPPYEDERCYETWRADGKDPGIGYVVENGKITVIQIYVSAGQTPDVADTHGLGIGATEEDIRRAFTDVKKTRGFYDRDEMGTDQDTKSDPGYIPEFWIEAESPDHKRSILFVTRANKVTSMNTGLKPMVLEPEHCI
jgi:hypothetical protein